MKKELVKLYIIGIIALVLSLVFDKRLIEWSLDLRTGILDTAMKTITSDWIVVAFAIIGFIILLKKKNSLILIISAAVSFLIGYGLKFLIMRPRPQIEHLVIETGYAMPSTHAIVLFAMLPVLHKAYPKYLWIWLLAAAVISFSRFYAGVHHISDLLAGAMIGYLIGLLILWLSKKYKLKVF